MKSLEQEIKESEEFVELLTVKKALLDKFILCCLRPDFVGELEQSVGLGVLEQAIKETIERSRVQIETYTKYEYYYNGQIDGIRLAKLKLEDE